MTEAPKQEIAYKPELDMPNSWFKGYLAGNSIWPQGYFGIGIFVLKEVLSNPPHDWTEFTNSRFSDSQLSTLSSVMANMHKKEDINVTIKDQIESFNGIWKISKKLVTKMVLTFIALTEPQAKLFADWVWGKYYNHTPEQQIRIVNKFLKRPRSQRFKNLVGVINEISTALKSDQVKGLLEKRKWSIINEGNTVEGRNGRRQTQDLVEKEIFKKIKDKRLKKIFWALD